MIQLAVLVRRQRHLDERLLWQADELSRLSGSDVGSTWIQEQGLALDELLDKYYECQGTRDEQVRLFKCIRRIVSRLRSDPQALARLKEDADRMTGGLAGKAMAALPDLPKKDERTLVYVMLGLSNRSVCVLIEEDINNYYRLKSRLRKRIESSTLSAPEKAKLLQYFRPYVRRK